MDFIKECIKGLMPMYFVSKNFSKISLIQLQSMQRTMNIHFPKAYTTFLSTYGMGTYCGLLCIGEPDDKLLKEYPYMPYDDDTFLLSQEQLAECVVLFSTMDGDYLVMHPQKDGLILLPRHSDEVQIFKFTGNDLFIILDEVINYLYKGEIQPYFEPWNAQQKHLFMGFHSIKHENIETLATLFIKTFKHDFLIQNEYTCEVFITELEGYVVFRNAIEVLLVCNKSKSTIFREICEFLIENDCVLKTT